MRKVTTVVLGLALGLVAAGAATAQERAANELAHVFSPVMVDESGRSAGVLQRDDDRTRDRTRGRTGDVRRDDEIERRDRQRGRTGDIGRRDRRTTTRGGRTDDGTVTRDREAQRGRNDRASRSGRNDGGILGGTTGKNKGKNGKGPKFCQNGNGHPVHGRAWCREKGFGTGGEIFGYESRSRVGDIVFPSPRRRTNDGVVQGGVLGDILGDVVLGRLNQYARNVNGGGVSGRWVGDDELQLFAGRTRVARLVDVNGDSRADYLFLRGDE